MEELNIQECGRECDWVGMLQAKGENVRDEIIEEELQSKREVWK